MCCGLAVDFLQPLCFFEFYNQSVFSPLQVRAAAGILGLLRGKDDYKERALRQLLVRRCINTTGA
jgi:hypothetical protein